MHEELRFSKVLFNPISKVLGTRSLTLTVGFRNIFSTYAGKFQRKVTYKRQNFSSTARFGPRSDVVPAVPIALWNQTFASRWNHTSGESHFLHA